MKKQTHMNFLIRTILVLVMAFVFGHLSGCVGYRRVCGPENGPPVRSQSVRPVEGEIITESQMLESCQEMMKKKQKMMAYMKAQDDELTEQVARMNIAPEAERLSLLAAVVTRMVEQQTIMNEHKENMQEEMMEHMMEHMQEEEMMESMMEHMQMGKESMMQCPMMKGM